MIGAVLGTWALLALLARPVVDVRAHLVLALASTASFGVLYALAWRFEAPTRRVVERLLAVPPWALAAGFALAAGVAGQAVLGDVPHTSDEVAYQFQARALAQGRLGFAPPPADEAEFFRFVHTTSDGGVWHGIMNPGWPGVLALGFAVGLPGAVNPLLGALSLLVLAALLARSGLDGPTRAAALWLLAVSPFFLFMSGSYMAHPVSLLLFLVLAWAVMRWLERPGWGAVAVAGGALGLNLIVRPIDAAVTAAPFCALLLTRGRRGWAAAAGIGALAMVGAGLLLAYNRALTGDPLVFPQELYFSQRFPGLAFGLGFGDNMGSPLHGPEWPGYHLGDAPRVTAHRLIELLRDVHAAPWVLLAAVFAGVAERRRRGFALLAASSAALLAIFAAHFYHGIAYGSRHYYLMLPFLVTALALPVGRGLVAGGAPARRARAALLALLVLSVAFAWPPLVREYGTNYRDASPGLRRAVAARDLDRALVFVSQDHWGWKSGFPLNEYPLERNDVLFARDLGAENARLIARHPGRSLWRARVAADGSAELERIGSENRIGTEDQGR